MQQLPETTKQEIIKLIEIALEPISGKVKEFGEPFQMAHIAQQGYTPEIHWDEYLLPVIIQSTEGEVRLTLSSLHMPDPWDMVEVALRDDLLKYNHLSEQEKEEVQNIIYSKEFLALRQKK